MGERGRPLVIGGLIGLIVVAAIGAYVLLVMPSSAQSGDIDELLVIALTEDADGAQVAGLIGVLGDAEVLRVVDPMMDVEASGTSYSLLKDQYPFGGGEAVSQSFADAEGTEPLPWVVLAADEWIEIVDEAGGVGVEVETGVNAYVRGELFIVEPGSQELTGGESYALASATLMVSNEEGSDPAAAEGLSAAVLETVRGSWALVVSAVEGGAASSSLSAETLQNLGQ